MAKTLTSLIKTSVTVTVYRGHRQTLFFLSEIISLFIMCIIKNNYFVGGRAKAETRTLATKCVMRYCTWHLSALYTGPRGQVPVCSPQTRVRNG